MSNNEEKEEDVGDKTNEDVSAQVSADVNADKIEVEPNKRLEHTEPEELAYALKQVFSGEEKIDSQTDWALKDDRSDRSDYPYPSQAAADSASAPQVEAKSGYSSPFALFADIFYGMLIAPRQTLFILSDSKKFPPSLANLFLTFVLVLGVLMLPAGIKIGAAADGGEGTIKALGFITGNMLNWLVLAFILYYLSIWLRGNRLSVGNAFIATGWAYLPFAFFAPIACFKTALGHNFLALAVIPAVWFILLQWLAFQTSLRTSTIKMAMIALVVPPVFCLVYLFWIGLAVCSLMAQILSHLS